MQNTIWTEPNDIYTGRVSAQCCQVFDARGVRNRRGCRSRRRRGFNHSRGQNIWMNHPYLYIAFIKTRRGEYGCDRPTRTLLSSPPVASLYDWAVKSLSLAGRAFLNGIGWKSHELMGLLSCQRISSVRTRIFELVVRVEGQEARGHWRARMLYRRVTRYAPQKM